MAQMGASSVQRTRWNGVDAIVKSSPSAVELAFYQHTAPLLRAAGIHIPELFSVEYDRLVIERIPHPVTLDDFHSCDTGLAQIAKLHCADIPPSPHSNAMAGLRNRPIKLWRYCHCQSAALNCCASVRHAAIRCFIPSKSFPAIPTVVIGANASMATGCCLTGNVSAMATSRSTSPR